MTTSPESHDWLRGHSRELDLPECLDLLASGSVGRVAYCTQEGPVVLPVNYVLHDGDVVFRTSPHGSIAQHLQGSPAAFEVDEIHDVTESGWSVLIQGTGEFVESARDLPLESRPSPWPVGNRALFIRVRARSVTGRMLTPG